MQNILLLNVHSLKNAGDAALTKVAVDQIKANFPGCKLSLVLDDPDGAEDYGQIISSLNSWLKRADTEGYPHWNLVNVLLLIPTTIIPLFVYRFFNFRFLQLTPGAIRNLLKAYFRADIIISQPGGFLYSSGRGLVLLINLYSLGMALITGKPLYIFPQSVGPFFQSWEKYLVRWILSSARIVMAREPESLELLGSLGIPEEKILLVPDLAFAFHGRPREVGEKWFRKFGYDSGKDDPLLGITVINWSAENKRFHNQQAYEDAVARSARAFIEINGGKVVFFTQVCGPSMSQDDRIPTRRVISQLQDISESILFIEEPIPPEVLKPIYGFMDIFVGTRMHSNIFAVSEAVPVIAIGYQHKTRGMMTMMDLSEWTIDINKLDIEQLQNRFSSLWENRQAVQEHLHIAIPPLIEQAEHAGDYISRDYNLIRQS